MEAFHAGLVQQSHEWTHTSTKNAPHRQAISYQCKSQRCGFTFLSNPMVFAQTHESMMGLLELFSICDSILLLADYDEKCMTHPLVDQVSLSVLCLCL
jgi:hypothetical protein